MVDPILAEANFVQKATDVCARRLRLVSIGYERLIGVPIPPALATPLFDALYLVTAHIGGALGGRDRRMEELVDNQVDRRRAGDPFVNLVDP